MTTRWGATSWQHQGDCSLDSVTMVHIAASSRNWINLPPLYLIGWSVYQLALAFQKEYFFGITKGKNELFGSIWSGAFFILILGGIEIYSNRPFSKIPISRFFALLGRNLIFTLLTVSKKRHTASGGDAGGLSAVRLDTSPNFWPSWGATWYSLYYIQQAMMRHATPGGNAGGLSAVRLDIRDSVPDPVERSRP